MRLEGALRASIFLALIPIVLTACSGSGAPSGVPLTPNTPPTSNPAPTSSPSATTAAAIPPPPGASESVTIHVDDSAGAVLSLPSGVRGTFPAGSLDGSATVQVATIPDLQLTNSSPNGDDLVGGISFTIQVDGAVSTRSLGRIRNYIVPPAADPTNAISFVIPGPTNFSFDNLTLPFATMTADDGTTIPMAFPVAKAAASGFYVVSLPTIYLLRQGINAKKIFSGYIHWLHIRAQSSSSKRINAPYGLRYFDPVSGGWTAQPGLGSAVSVHGIGNYRTLFVLHGILSCVEDSFSPAMLAELGTNGEYLSIIGYDYDWTKRPKDVVPAIAAALNGLNLSDIDIAAHSYGGVMAMSLVPKLANPASLENVAFYGSPLNGAVVHDPRWPLTAIATVGGPFSMSASTSLFQTVTQWSGIYDRADSELQAIRNEFKQHAPNRVIKVAGNGPLFSGIGERFWEQSFRAIGGISSLPPFDGIVSVDSALDSTIASRSVSGYSYSAPSQTVAIGPVNLSHIQIVNDRGDTDSVSKAIEFVSPVYNVNASSPVNPTLVTGASIFGFVMKGVGAKATLTFSPSNSGGAAESGVLDGSSVTGNMTTTASTITADGVTPWTATFASPVSAIENRVFYFATPLTSPTLDSWTSIFLLWPDCVTCTNAAFSQNRLLNYQSVRDQSMSLRRHIKAAPR